MGTAPSQQQIVHVHVRVTKDEVVSNETNLTSDINRVYGEGVVSDADGGGTESIRSLKEKCSLLNRKYIMPIQGAANLRHGVTVRIAANRWNR